MTAAAESLSSVPTLADLMGRLGDVPPWRILTPRPPGLATENDVVELHVRYKRLCELVEGVLVEKAMGYEASVVAMFLVHALQGHVLPRDLGLVSGPDGMMRLFPGLVRIPDVAFVSWSRLPKKRVPKEAIPSLVPDLAVEVLSEGNTPAEMRRKLQDYFDAGTQLVWIVDPDQRTVTVFTTVDRSTVPSKNDDLDGGPVLPGFRVHVGELFARLENVGN